MTGDAPDASLRVALVVYGELEATSGGFRYDRQIVARLRERGDTVDVIELPWRRYPRGVADALDPRIRDRLNRDVDVLIQDGLCHPSVWRHNRRLTRPDAVVGLLHHLRSDDPTERFAGLIRPFERRFLRSVDATIATSEFTRERAERLAPTTRSIPGVVAAPAGRLESAASTPAAVRERAAREPLHVVFVGNVVPRKDPETLLDAIGRLDRRERSPPVRLTVVGSHDAAPAYARRVIKRATRLGLDDRVSFVGELSSEALVETLASAHVCCVPARYEAFGMVHLEAMEHGVVPIAGSTGGTAEFVADGENGFLVEPGSDRALADRLDRLATDRERLTETGIAALRTAESHPTWAETGDRIRDFLRGIATARPAGASGRQSGGECA